MCGYGGCGGCGECDFYHFNCHLLLFTPLCHGNIVLILYEVLLPQLSLSSLSSLHLLLSLKVLQLSLWGGVMRPYTPSKINDRFLLGGPTTLRGFGMWGVGPREQGSVADAPP